MKYTYDDILMISYPFQNSQKRMTMKERGAQFKPFAALTGYDAAIRESSRLTDKQLELAVDACTILDEKLKHICQIWEKQLDVTVTYFIPDINKPGGFYSVITGKIKRIDNYQKTLMLWDGTNILLENICDIDVALFYG